MLIIDDEEMIRELTKDILEMQGYNIITATNGFEGIETFEQQHANVDAVVLDMSMPMLSGYETFLKLREIDSSVPIVLSTGNSDSDDAQNLISQGVEGIAQKPYRMDEFISLIEKVISRKKK